MSAAGVLLDTCAAIWLANGDPMAPAAMRAIEEAGSGAGIFVSPVSAWEIGLLSRPRGNRQPMAFLPDPKTWFARLIAAPGVTEAPLTAAIAVDASWLPGDIHGDPGDRLMVSTARDRRIPLVTRDAAILAYSRQGFVSVLPC